jgi:hypothetical protein
LPKGHKHQRGAVPGRSPRRVIIDTFDPDAPIEIPDDLPSFTTPERYVAFVKRQREAEFLRRVFMRLLVDQAELHRYCAHNACRRAGGCRSPDVVCFHKHNDELQVTVLPEFRAALRAERERRAAAGEWPGEE